MEPEIARRCPDCGASVRGNAFFCPQCGRTLREGDARASSSSPAAEAPETPARRITGDGRSVPTIAPPESVAEPASGVVPAQETFAHGTTVEGRPRADVAAQRADRDDGRSKRQRVTAAAREAVEEKLSPRVEKLRQASNVMLEEASYDPSLRFMLVAVAIVLLSLLLLLLNYLLG